MLQFFSFSRIVLLIEKRMLVSCNLVLLNYNNTFPEVCLQAVSLEDAGFRNFNPTEVSSTVLSRVCMR